MTKNVQIALIILVILVGIYFLNKNSQTKFESTSEAIFNDEPEDIFKFLIQQDQEAIELSRVDTLWRISGNDTLEVKSRSMDNLFDKVLKVNRGTIISENPEKYGKYSVDDSTGTHLAVITQKEKRLDIMSSDVLNLIIPAHTFGWAAIQRYTWRIRM